MAIENAYSVSAKIPQELYEQVLVYTKEKNISIASLIKTLLANEVNTPRQNQEQSGTINQNIPSGNINQNTSFILPDNLENILNQLLENSRQTTSLLNSYLSGTTQEKNQEQSGIDILYQINKNLEKLSLSIIDDKSSKISKTPENNNQPTPTKKKESEDIWDNPKPEPEKPKRINQEELIERQARITELKNQINPMPHYTHLEICKDEDSIVYQEMYKQYKLRYNEIPSKKLGFTFELLNYMAPVLKTEKICREFFEKLELAEDSKHKHPWQQLGHSYEYNLLTFLTILAGSRIETPDYERIELSNFQPYKIETEVPIKKQYNWDV